MVVALSVTVLFAIAMCNQTNGRGNRSDRERDRDLHRVESRLADGAGDCKHTL